MHLGSGWRCQCRIALPATSKRQGRSSILKAAACSVSRSATCCG
jgi:hypothetical protein